MKAINSDDEKKDNSNTSNIGLLDALKDCPNLEILGLRKVDHSPEQWLDFYDTLWSRLRILSLGGEENDDDFADFGTWFQNRMHSNLSKRLRFLKESECPQDLTLFTRRSNTALDEFQMFLLLMFPGLKRLTWQLAVGYYPIDNHNRNRNHHDAEDDEVNIRNHYECKTPMSILAFMTVAETRDRLCLRHLESLTVPNRYFDSLDFKIVIEFMLHLRELDLRGTNFDESSWITLKATDRYQYQLRVLNIHNCSQVTGAVIQDMLSSMPNLEVLEADYITDSDILQDRLQPQLQSHQPPSLQPRPWVCLGLKTLNLAILIFEQPTMTTQPMILDRIATLEKLECWNMIIPYTVLERIVHDRTDSGDYQSYNDDNGDKETNLESHYLRLTLEQGLDRLKDLSHLKHILVSMSSSLAPWSESEARWVKRHWKDLEGMCGFVLDDKAREILWAQVKIY
ncbi:hypothetical protein BGZ83_009292 [Gryganskiella cystojenkinii]|nr:hypothetical protein BGZ83_009292 [Gryganskiella cystojenkinii]